MIVHFWFRWLLVVSLLCGVFEVACVGYKRRLAEAEAASSANAEPEAVASSSTAEASTPARGGVRQRMAARETADAAASSAASSGDTVGDLPLVAELKKDWAKGKATSAQVQRYALAAARQGATGIDRLGAAGTSGRNPQNLLRDLIGIFGHPVGAPPFDWVEIPTTAGPRSPHPFLLPHSFFQHFYSGARSNWVKAVRGPPSAPREFWDAMAGSDFLRLHPRRDQQEWRRTIPLGLHGDAGAFSHQDSLMTISWNSLLGSGVTMQKRFLITVVRKSEMVAGTLDAIFRYISWSFNVLQLGQTPSENFLGMATGVDPTPLAEGWCGQLCQIRGDWQFYGEVFHIPKWNEAQSMCWLCRASNTDPALLWQDCRQCAGWRGTLWTHEGYMRHIRASGFPIPVLLMCVIGLRIECLTIDTLHAVDLGIAAHIVGNVLFVFGVLRSCFGGSNMAEKCKRIHDRLMEFYKRTKCANRLRGKLTLERLRASASDWPKLKAKGAACRKMAEFALEVALAFAGDSDEDRTMVEIVRLLVRFYHLIDDESMFLSAAARVELPRLGQRLAELYSKLSTLHFGLHNRLWKMTPKLHLWEHLCAHQVLVFGNPRCCWCYADEDLVGQMVDIAETCHPTTMAMTVLFKWLTLYFSGEEWA